MKKRWSVLGVIGVWVVACGGERFNDVGDLNSGGKGGTRAGSGSSGGGSTGAGAAGGKGGAGGKDGAGGKGGAGGQAGTGVTTPQPEGGMGGEGPEICDRENGCIFQTDAEITTLKADATRLYWVEHGSFDELDNYRHDGRLLARAFDSEDVDVVATGLEGPVGLALTSEYFYVYLDQIWEGKRRNALARLPREGGEVEVVMLDVAPTGGGRGRCPTCFVSDEDGIGYFPNEDGIYAIAPSDTTPTLLAEARANMLSVGGGYLYYTKALPDPEAAEELWRKPLPSGDSELVTASSPRFAQLHQGTVYALDETGEGEREVCLVSMPGDGGPWTRLPPVRAGYWAWRLQLLDELYFHDTFVTPDHWTLIQGKLTDTAHSEVVLSVPDSEDVEDWVGTKHAVYWTDGSRIIERPIETQ